MKNATFTPDMLKPGYICKLRNGNFVGVYTGTVRESIFSKPKEVMVVSGNEDWCPVDGYNDAMEYIGPSGKREECLAYMDIMEVWGFAPPKYASNLSSKGRPFMWKREEDDVKDVKDAEEETEHKNLYEGMSEKEAIEQFKKDVAPLGVEGKMADELIGAIKSAAAMAALAQIFGEDND